MKCYSAEFGTADADAGGKAIDCAAGPRSEARHDGRDSIRHRHPRLYALSLVLGLVLAAAAIGLFAADFHTQRTRVRLQAAADWLRSDVLGKMATYERGVAAVAADANVMASLSLLSQHDATSGKLPHAWDAERKDLAADLRRLSANSSHTHIALVDSRNNLVSLLSLGADDGIQADTTGNLVQSGLQECRLRNADDCLPAELPKALNALPSLDLQTRQTRWQGKDDRLLFTVTEPIFGTDANKRTHRLGHVILVHEFTAQYLKQLANQAGVDVAIHLSRAELPPGLEQRASGSTAVPSLLMAPVDLTPDRIRTSDRLIEARSIRLADNSHAYFLFSAEPLLPGPRVMHWLAAILVVLLISSAYAWAPGKMRANRWPWRPAQALQPAMGVTHRDQSERLPQTVAGPGEYAPTRAALAGVVQSREPAYDAVYAQARVVVQNIATQANSLLSGNAPLHGLRDGGTPATES